MEVSLKYHGSIMEVSTESDEESYRKMTSLLINGVAIAPEFAYRLTNCQLLRFMRNIKGTLWETDSTLYVSTGGSFPVFGAT
jgi:hypothetical protein